MEQVPAPGDRLLTKSEAVANATYMTLFSLFAAGPFVITVPLNPVTGNAERSTITWSAEQEDVG